MARFPLPARYRRLRSFIAFASCVALAACAGFGQSDTARRWSGAEQLIVVITANWNAATGELRRYERTGRMGGNWREVGDVSPVVIGRSGSAWGIGLHPPQSRGPVKREGDGRSPAGIFALGTAFGYAGTAASALPYRGMTASDYCIDVPASPLYNRIVDAREAGAKAVAGSTEPMRRDLHAGGDQRYRLGFVIEHNPHAQPQGGSCIFAHLWKAPDAPTAGCTAMADGTMEALLGWLDPGRKPVFVLLPAEEYRRVGADWGLPELPTQ